MAPATAYADPAAEEYAGPTPEERWEADRNEFMVGACGFLDEWGPAGSLSDAELVAIFSEAVALRSAIRREEEYHAGLADAASY